MQPCVPNLGITDKVTPHDLRRTHGSTITALGFGRDAMNRIQNHREGGIASVLTATAMLTSDPQAQRGRAGYPRFAKRSGGTRQRRGVA